MLLCHVWFAGVLRADLVFHNIGGLADTIAPSLVRSFSVYCKVCSLCAWLGGIMNYNISF